MTGSRPSVFVDANVLVYARDSSEEEKQRQAEAWIRELWKTGSGRVSMQVLQEFYVTVTQKLQPGMGRPAARGDVRDLLQWQPVLSDADLLDSAWRLQDRYDLAWWDAPVVAAAQRAGCRYLLSEDFHDETRFGDLVVLDPFRHAADSVLDEPPRRQDLT
jgi:predicted nucleic acid-binding protein